MCKTTSRGALAATALGVILSLAAISRAQEYDWGAPPVAAAQGQENPVLSEDQIDQLLEPIALYPDPLLAEILPASTYPLEVVQAAQWVQQWQQDNRAPSDRDIDGQPWDPPVKVLVRYPDVLKMMGEHADWVQALGAAFVNQPDDVTASIQRLRQRAIDAQNLPLDTPEQQVVITDGVIEILPADPDFCYVPDYDPILVFGRHDGRLHFGFTRYPIGIWLDIGFDWGHHRIIVGDGWHPGWDRDGKKWRRGEIAINNPVVKGWVRNRAQHRPVFPPALVRQAPRGGGAAPGAGRAAPNIPRVGTMKRPGPAPVVRDAAPGAASVLEQSATETKQAKDRFQQSRPQPQPAPTKVREAAPVREAPSSPPPTHTSTPRSTERSASSSGRESGLGNVTSSSDAKSQSDRGHQSMKKK